MKEKVANNMMSSMLIHPGEMIKDEIVARGLTQKDLAQKMGVSYFAYYSRQLGAKAYLCVRKIKNTGLFKPYAIIDQNTFDAEIQNMRK